MPCLWNILCGVESCAWLSFRADIFAPRLYFICKPLKMSSKGQEAYSWPVEFVQHWGRVQELFISQRWWWKWGKINIISCSHGHQGLDTFYIICDWGQFPSSVLVVGQLCISRCLCKQMRQERTTVSCTSLSLQMAEVMCHEVAFITSDIGIFWKLQLHNVWPVCSVKGALHFNYSTSH